MGALNARHAEPAMRFSEQVPPTADLTPMIHEFSIRHGLRSLTSHSNTLNQGPPLHLTSQEEFS